MSYRCSVHSHAQLPIISNPIFLPFQPKYRIYPKLFLIFPDSPSWLNSHSSQEYEDWFYAGNLIHPHLQKSQEPNFVTHFVPGLELGFKNVFMYTRSFQAIFMHRIIRHYTQPVIWETISTQVHYMFLSSSESGMIRGRSVRMLIRKSG